VHLLAVIDEHLAMPRHTPAGTTDQPLAAGWLRRY
jgi:hypothetical protein